MPLDCRGMRQALLVFLSFLCCNAPRSAPLNPPAAGLSTVDVGGVPCDVFVPDAPVGTVLVLPGWNFDRGSWRKNSSIEEQARKHHLILILPDMLKTLYETSYYPETTLRWNKTPGSQFIHDTLIPEMQKRYSLLMPGQRNFVLGLSTGGRGVAMTILENPKLFAAGAAFSGDYAQERMPGEAINAAIWGPYALFPDRWKGRDNPARRASEWQTPIYLAHGLDDRVVPPDQTQMFGDLLSARDKTLVEVHLKAGYGHDYRFWDSQLAPAFEFFSRH